MRMKEKKIPKKMIEEIINSWPDNPSEIQRKIDYAYTKSKGEVIYESQKENKNE